ncbi:VWA domain-containing protein [Tunturiibacter lichenicola]|uniref:VWA domain-containing protein n=1 Tax=Tunturiibacter lichenicola TaxID=2051959 RepID=UPI0021B466A7|nr:VWA domain-containing protein [Edaphobacter lichenicola]
MKMRLREFVVFVGVWSGAAFAQTTLHTTTTLVVVPTLVQTPDKDLVFSLRAEDFVLTDNGVPQKVTLEEETRRPLSLVVLMQTGGDARGQFPSYAHLDTMIAELLGEPPNEVSVVNFDSQPEAASPFTTNVAEWGDAIDHPDVGDRGAAIFDGIAYGLDLLQKRPAGNRRAILLISQAHDVGSKTPLKELVRGLGETNTAIYSVTFSAEKTAARQAFKDPPHLNPPISLYPSDGGIKPYNDPARPVAGFKLDAPLALIFGAMSKNTSAEVATLSGGEWSSFDNAQELSRDLGVLTNHLHNSYVLSFTPTSSEPGLHTIKVRLARHPELVVSARSNYWASDQSSQK